MHPVVVLGKDIVMLMLQVSACTSVGCGPLTGVVQVNTAGKC